MELWIVKTLATLLMLLVMLLCVLIPLKLVSKMRSLGNRGASILMTLACFTGGVFLGTVLMFLLPEVSILINSWLSSKGMVHVYPVPELVVGIGFFLITFLERAIIACNCIGKKKKKQSTTLAVTQNFLPPSEPLQKLSPPTSPLYSGIYLTTVMRKEIFLTGKHRSYSDGVLTDSCEPQTFVQRYRKSSTVGVDFNDRGAAFEEDAKSEAEAYAVTKAVILFVALITDEFLGGISMGLQRSQAAVWSVWIGLMAHETIVGIGFALQLSALPKSKQTLALILAIVYAIFSPLGGAAGTLIYAATSGGANTDALNGILQGLATGVFLYVTFFEILEGKVNSESRWIDLVAIFAGFMLMATIPWLSPPILPDSFHSIDSNRNCSY